MGETPQVRYNTDITREHYYKYKPITDRPWNFILKPGRPLTYPNDMNIASKTFDGFKHGITPGVVHGLVVFVDKIGSSSPWIMSNLSVFAESLHKYGSPWLIAGTVFGLSTSMSANYRKKDDYINHAIGGALAASVFGMWYKNPRNMVWHSLAGGLLGGVNKYCVDEGVHHENRHRRIRIFNFYRRAWFTEPLDPEGDPELDYHVRRYMNGY